ncbi:MAG TPA: hypothetical protein V6C84_00815 [Coleofasciculaceae cyanobacterium]
MTLRLKILLSSAVVLSCFLTAWNHLVLPQLFPEIACAMEQVYGATTKTWHSDCQPNMNPAGLLKAR